APCPGPAEPRPATARPGTGEPPGQPPLDGAAQQQGTPAPKPGFLKRDRRLACTHPPAANAVTPGAIRSIGGMTNARPFPSLENRPVGAGDCPSDCRNTGGRASVLEQTRDRLIDFVPPGTLKIASDACSGGQGPSRNAHGSAAEPWCGPRL